MPAARYGTWIMRKKHCPSGGGATVWAVEDSDAVMSPDMSTQSEASPGFIWTRYVLPAVENQFKVTLFPDAATKRNVGGEGTASPSAMGSTRNFLNSRVSKNLASMPSS